MTVTTRYYETPAQPYQPRRRRSGSYLDMQAELESAYQYPTTFGAEIQVGTRVVGALGTEAEVNDWDYGVIEWISEDRTEARVRWGEQVRAMGPDEVIA